MNTYEQVYSEVRPMSLKQVYAQLTKLGCSEIKQDRPRSASIGCILPNGVIFNCGDCRDLLIDMIVNPSEYAPIDHSKIPTPPMDWERLIATESAIADVLGVQPQQPPATTEGGYTIWFADLARGENEGSIVARYPSLDGVQRQMYVWYIEEKNKHTVMPQLPISNPDLSLFTGFTTFGENGAPLARYYARDQWGYDVLEPMQYFANVDYEATLEYAEPIPSDTPEQPQQISIEEQMKIWDAHTPRWSNFPASDQSAIYVLGSQLEGDTLPGAIIVFNARRHTVRAYSNTSANRDRFWRLGGKFGRVGNSIAYILLIDGDQPNGAPMPSDIGRVHLPNGKSIYWGCGIAMLMREEMARNSDQNDWVQSILDSLAQNHVAINLWGHILKFWPTLGDTPQPTIGKSDQIRAELSAGGYVESAKNAIIEWRNGREGYQWYVSIPRDNGNQPPIEMYWRDHNDGGFNFHFVLGASIRPIVPSEDDLLEYAALNGDLEQIPFNPEIKYPTAKQSPLLAELLAQWHWFNDLVNSAFESGDLDRAENAAVYAYALNGVAQNMFDRRFTF